MKTSRYTEAQIISILRQAEGSVPVAQLFRELGMSDASFYKSRARVWRDALSGFCLAKSCRVTDASMISQRKAMDRAIGTPLVRETMARENRRLKRIHADLSMQADLLHCEGERHWSERT